MKLLVPGLCLGLLFCSCESSRLAAGSPEVNISGNAEGAADNASHQLSTSKPAGWQDNASTEVLRTNADTSGSLDRISITDTETK